MTHQEMFEKAVRGVLAQGRLAQDSPGGSCFYEMQDGSRCAAGHLLTDEQIAQVIEREANENSFASINSWLHVVPAENQNFVADLQQVHDGAIDLEDFKNRLGLFVLEWKLTPFEEIAGEYARVKERADEIA